jgi:hypothetical protein
MVRRYMVLQILEEVMRLLPALIVGSKNTVMGMLEYGVTCLDYRRGRNASVMYTGHLHGSRECA